MSRIVLEGGTDIAEMVLFSVDKLPLGGIDDRRLADLEAGHTAIRMPTGADGGYLLHLYLDEEIPESLRQYCVVDDALKFEFRTDSGRIGFGGAESAFADFKQNTNIRSDGAIPPGVYEAVTYHTEYPEEMVEQAVEEAIGRAGMRKLGFPSDLTLGMVVLTIVLLAYAFNGNYIALVGVVAVIVGGKPWSKYITNSPAYKSLKARKLEIEYEYPSIVMRFLRRSD